MPAMGSWKVVRDQRIHRSVNRDIVNNQSVAQYSFELTSDSFSCFSTRDVVMGRDDLQSRNADRFKGKTCCKTATMSCNSSALGRLSHPIPEVCESLLTIEMVDAHPAKDRVGVCIDNKHLEAIAEQPGLSAESDPALGRGVVVVGRAPVLPATDGSHGFAHCLGQQGGIGHSVGAQAQDAVGQVVRVGNGIEGHGASMRRYLPMMLCSDNVAFS